MEDISRLFDILTQYEEKWPNQKIALAGKKMEFGVPILQVNT